MVISWFSCRTCRTTRGSTTWSPSGYITPIGQKMHVFSHNAGQRRPELNYTKRRSLLRSILLLLLLPRSPGLVQCHARRQLHVVAILFAIRSCQQNVQEVLSRFRTVSVYHPTGPFSNLGRARIRISNCIALGTAITKASYPRCYISQLIRHY